VPQLAHAFEVILRDPAFRPGFHLCVECRRLRSVPSREELFATGLEVRSYGLSWQTDRLALVVRRPHWPEAGRSIPMVLPAVMIARLRVVSSLREALKWFDSPKGQHEGR
jgi:hypothetical protein